MSNSTRFECPNCGEQHSVVMASEDDVDQAQLECSSCGENIIVAFEAN